MLVRLNKLLSQHGVASRRAADVLIGQGRVEVNGQIVQTLGGRVDPDRDDIRVDAAVGHAPLAAAVSRVVACQDGERVERARGTNRSQAAGARTG